MNENLYLWIYRNLTRKRSVPVYHAVAPANGEFPRIVYTVVSATPADDGLSEQGGMSILLQIDVYARTMDDLFEAQRGIYEEFDIPDGEIIISADMSLASSELSNISDTVEYGDPDKAGEELIFRRTFEFYLHTN
jgi:hypothetical protein